MSLILLLEEPALGGNTCEVAVTGAAANASLASTQAKMTVTTTVTEWQKGAPIPLHIEFDVQPPVGDYVFTWLQRGPDHTPAYQWTEAVPFNFQIEADTLEYDIELQPHPDDIPEDGEPINLITAHMHSLSPWLAGNTTWTPVDYVWLSIEVGASAAAATTAIAATESFEATVGVTAAAASASVPAFQNTITLNSVTPSKMFSGGHYTFNFTLSPAPIAGDHLHYWWLENNDDYTWFGGVEVELEDGVGTFDVDVEVPLAATLPPDDYVLTFYAFADNSLGWAYADHVDTTGFTVLEYDEATVDVTAAAASSAIDGHVANPRTMEIAANAAAAGVAIEANYVGGERDMRLAPTGAAASVEIVAVDTEQATVAVTTGKASVEIALAESFDGTVELAASPAGVSIEAIETFSAAIGATGAAAGVSIEARAITPTLATVAVTGAAANVSIAAKEENLIGLSARAAPANVEMEVQWVPNYYLDIDAQAAAAGVSVDVVRRKMYAAIMNESMKAIVHEQPMRPEVRPDEGTANIRR